MTEFNSGRGGRDDDIVDLEAQPVNATGNSAEGSSREPIKQEPLSGTVTVAHIVYCLHSISILIGLLTAGLSIAGAFVFSAPSILAVIINYIFRSDASGTWLESHFSWQIRTFWYALLWLVVLYLVSLPLVFFGIGIFVFIAGMLVLGIWVDDVSPCRSVGDGVELTFGSEALPVSVVPSPLLLKDVVCLRSVWSEISLGMCPSGPSSLGLW